MPSYYYEVYHGSWRLVVGGVADTFLFGVFWGYGFLRSGGVLPWALVHALSDLTGF